MMPKTYNSYSVANIIAGNIHTLFTAIQNGVVKHKHIIINER